MGTSTLKWAFFALLIQVAASFPSFGAGDQLELWNEVDDEHPGEKLPADYMMPMRDPNGNINEKTAEEAKAKTAEQTATTPSRLNTETNLIKAVPNMLTDDKRESKTAPVSSVEQTVTTVKARDPLLKHQVKEVRLENSEKLTVTSHNPITNNIPKPVPERLTTVKPQTKKHLNVDDKTGQSKISANQLSKVQEKKHNPILIVRITALPSRDELPAPTPTPRPPTESQEEDCECEECEEAIENEKSGTEIGEDMDYQDTAELSTNDGNRREIGINSDMKALRQSPLSLLQNVKKDDTLEDVFGDVVKVMSRMSISDKESFFKSIPLSPTQEEKMRIPNNNDMPKIIAGILMKVSMVKSDNEKEEQSDSLDEHLKKSVPSIKLSSFNREDEDPIVKSILLKSILSRRAPKDLFDFVKENQHNGMENKMITSLNNVFKNRINKQSRFVALQNQGYTSLLPPLHFPEESAPLTMDERELPRIPLLIKGRPSDNMMVNHIINSLRRPELSSLSNMHSSIDGYNDHMRKFDPQMKGLFDNMFKQMAEHEAQNIMKNQGLEPLSIINNMED